jgi:hypothetical protein
VADEEVEVQWLQIPRLFVLIASENVAVMLALGSTPVRGSVVDGTVLVLTTVGAGRAAQAIPAAKSSTRAIVVNSSSVFLMIFLFPPLGVSCTKGSSFVALLP